MSLREDLISMFSKEESGMKILSQLMQRKGISCIECPFRDGEEEASIVQNYGCLPTKFDMIKMLEGKDVAISCHRNEKISCHGLSKARNTVGKKVLPYETWYRIGEKQ
jgi:hypothetical protein